MTNASISINFELYYCIQVLLVTGGWDGGIRLSTTEVLAKGDDRWKIVGTLPRSMAGVGAISIDNTIIVTG